MCLTALQYANVCSPEAAEDESSGQIAEQPVTLRSKKSGGIPSTASTSTAAADADAVHEIALHACGLLYSLWKGSFESYGMSGITLMQIKVPCYSLCVCCIIEMIRHNLFT